MEELFSIGFTGHEVKARKLLLQKGFKTSDELALMTLFEIEQAINAEFKAIGCGEDWMLIPNDLWSDFQALVTWIKR